MDGGEARTEGDEALYAVLAGLLEQREAVGQLLECLGVQGVEGRREVDRVLGAGAGAGEGVSVGSGMPWWRWPLPVAWCGVRGLG